MAILLTSALVATMHPGQAYGLIENGAVVLENGQIAWVGPASQAPGADTVIDCAGRLVTPGLIDCHTHIVYAGNRAGEFERRLEGETYSDIAKAGGGILSTVMATRAASKQQLINSALVRLDALLGEGVTTIEIKSGYGLDVETELKMLRSARALADHRPVDVVTSFLGAHAFPPEFAGDHDGYVDLVCDRALSAVAEAGLADAVDGFCEGIALSCVQIERVFNAARALNLPVKLHAEQLSNLGGAAVAAKYGALSVDHIEYLDPGGVEAIARSGTCAVLLPGAFYYLNETQRPPVQALRDAKVPIAVATDLNPGSSPVHSLLSAMNMACVLFGLTPEEALRGVTANAAKALGLADRGVIARGQKADLAIWNAQSPGELAYPLGFNPLAAVVRNGKMTRGTL